jgi:putative sterol carrier protein
MAVLYPSEEWIKELQKVCNQDPEFKTACGDFAGKFIFQIEAEPPKLDRPANLFLSVEQGEAKEAMSLSSVGDRPDAEYVIAGTYAIWKKVVRGEQEPLRAIMTRRLKLTKGSQFKILKQARFAMKMINNCTKVDAVFVDEKG